VKLKELGEKISSRRLKVESGTPQTGDRRMPGGGSVFDRAVIVISQGVFYHTGMLKSRNFCKLLGMRRLGRKRDRQSEVGEEEKRSTL
jgi:hypothetical protein